jgi:LysM repeat protein
LKRREMRAIAEIARRYRMSLADLRQRNPGVRNRVIRPGDTLLIR